jgi:serine/threonine-protein kinase
MAIEVVGVVGGYQLDEVVGSDVLGMVHRGWDMRSGQPVLIRLLPLLGADPANAARFRRELEAVARLRHPAVLAVLDWGARAGVPYVVTDCGEADEGPVERLSDRLASGPLPDTALALAILRVLATGIDYAHDAGIVHGDLAPSAVLFGYEGVPKLTDLALGRVALVGGRPGDAMCVSPDRAAPERTQAGRARPALDVYGFAALAHEMLTGSPPRRSASGLEPPSAIVRDLPEAVDPVLLRGLATDPGARWETCIELVASLDAALAPAPRETAPPEPAPVVHPDAEPAETEAGAEPLPVAEALEEDDAGVDPPSAVEPAVDHPPLEPPSPVDSRPASWADPPAPAPPPAEPAPPGPPPPAGRTTRRARRGWRALGLGMALAGARAKGAGVLAATGTIALSPAPWPCPPGGDCPPRADIIAVPASATVSVTLDAGAARRAQWVTVRGAGFDPRQQYLVQVVQGGREWEVQSPTSPRADGSFSIPVQVPADAAAGPASVVACVVMVKRGPTSTCGRQGVAIQA